MQAGAPAKAILFGEHAVVYGQPAIAFPIQSLRCEVIIEKCNRSSTRIHSEVLGETLVLDGCSEHPLAYAWWLVGNSLAIEMPVAEITIHSDIPLAAGFGSGAALCTALFRACSQWLKRELPTDQLNELVYQMERRFHGNPSGIDNHVVVYERALYFQHKRTPEFLSFGTALPMIGIRCGEGAPTSAVVEDLQRRRQENLEKIQPLIEAIGVLTIEARERLFSGDLHGVGELMYENHQLLVELGVSSPEQDELVQLAKEKGALGAKMSGAGWGGQVLVLAKPGEQIRLMNEFRAAEQIPLFCEEIS